MGSVKRLLSARYNPALCLAATQVFSEEPEESQTVNIV